MKIINRKIFLGLTLLVLTLLSACNNESNWQPGQGELPSLIGARIKPEEQAFSPPLYLFDDYYEVIEKTGLQVPSSKWFIHDDEGEFGYGLPAGSLKPGSDFDIKLYRHEDKLQVQRNFKISLERLNENYQRQEEVMSETIFIDHVYGEQIIYSGSLPQQENTSYLMSLEIINKQGEIEDTMASLIYLPAEEINLELSTSKDSLPAKENLEITIDNYGPSYLAMGESYDIEKHLDGGWKVVPLDLAFNDIGIHLNPASEYTQMVTTDKLKPGKYRVLKSVYLIGLDQEVSLAAEFNIE